MNLLISSRWICKSLFRALLIFGTLSAGALPAYEVNKCNLTWHAGAGASGTGRTAQIQKGGNGSVSLSAFASALEWESTFISMSAIFGQPICLLAASAGNLSDLSNSNIPMNCSQIQAFLYAAKSCPPNTPVTVTW